MKLDTQTQAEYRRLLEEARPMDVPSLAGSFRKLGEYGDIVIAGRDLGTHGVEFVTWLRNTEGNGVCGGHYFRGDLDAAKRDFITRSRLLPDLDAHPRYRG